MNNIITHPEELLDYFSRSCQNLKKGKTGVEFEKLGVFSDSARAIPYQGKAGVTGILSSLNRRFGWAKVKEKGHMVALSRDDAQITLEPGGQLELSGSVLDNIHQIKKELEDHIQELTSVSEPLGIKWLGLGVHPVSDLEDIEWVPKERYRIMAPSMAKRGAGSHHMMKKTASIQVNVDYSSEYDFIQKMRTALALVPFTTTIFANSPLSRGKLNGFLTERAYIWNKTDPSRCGLLGENFSFNPGFCSYLEYALDVPMFFIIRDNQWIPVKNNMSFSEYIKKGYQGHRPTWNDWELHLSSIFTEVRARNYIEVRNADCQIPQFSLCVPALWKGILYSRPACQKVWSLVKDFSWEERCYLYSTVPQQGLQTKIKGIRVLELAKQILNAAYLGLKQQQSVNDGGEDESMYLEPLMQLVIEDEICPAQIIIKNWERSWHRRIDRLVDYCSY